MYEVKQTATFSAWLAKLKDNVAKVSILRRIVRLENGNLGDSKSVGEGVFELRIDVGQGYRVYFTNKDNKIIILLVGGDKSSQAKDISTAKDMAKDLTSYTEQPGVADPTTWKEEFTGDEDAENDFLNDDNWYEKKEFHFPAKTVAYENGKWVGYQGEFIGLRHVFSDYWVFNDGDPNSTDDNNLVSAVNNKDFITKLFRINSLILAYFS